MKKILLSLISVLLLSNSFAQNYEWAKSIGSAASDWGNSITTDASGNVYITGFYSNTADFDPGVDTANLISAGGYDIFVAKYDNNGNYLWAKSIGSTSDDYGNGIATDDSGNVFITGYFLLTSIFPGHLATSDPWNRSIVAPEPKVSLPAEPMKYREFIR